MIRIDHTEASGVLAVFYFSCPGWLLKVFIELHICFVHFSVSMFYNKGEKARREGDRGHELREWRQQKQTTLQRESETWSGTCRVCGTGGFCLLFVLELVMGTNTVGQYMGWHFICAISSEVFT